VNFLDCVSGNIRITNRRIRTNQGDDTKYIELSNKIFAPKNDVFVEVEVESDEIIFNSEFDINLMGIDTVLDIVHSYCDAGYGEMVLDVFLGGKYYGQLPSHYCNYWMPSDFESLKINDYNEDGLEDILVEISAISGVGQDAAVPFPTYSIYFQNNEGSFINFYTIDDRLGEAIDNPEKVKDLCSFIDFSEDKEDY